MQLSTPGSVAGEGPSSSPLSLRETASPSRPHHGCIRGRLLRILGRNSPTEDCISTRTPLLVLHPSRSKIPTYGDRIAEGYPSETRAPPRAGYSEYEYILCDDEKLTFRALRSGRAPEVSDVTALTAHIDKENSQRNGRCVGTRLTNILEAVQRFSTVIDGIVGGSQSILACTIWGVLKTAVLITLGSKAYFHGLSYLLMQIGRNTPRYQDLALLFPSAGVREALCEYFTSVVELCKHAVLFLRKGILAQLSANFMTTFQTEFGHYQTELKDLARNIQDEASIVAKREQRHELQQNKIFRTHITKFSKDGTARKRRRNKMRFLDDCSTYDYQSAWKQARKAGSSRWLYEKEEYKQWTQSDSGTLFCTGILGSGKTVLAANLVEELTIANPTPTTAVCYFFCRHNEPESLDIKTILGALGRQMLSHARPEIFDIVENWYLLPLSTNAGQVMEGLKQLLPLNDSTQTYYIIIDGLDECDELARRQIAMNLDLLRAKFNIHLFCSCRPDTGRLLLPFLRPQYRVSMEVQLDLQRYIETELEERLQNGDLCLGDPGLILRIRDALMNGSHGMFLWVVFQLESVCAEPNDEGILNALQSLPKDLPETYNRILRSLTGSTNSDSGNLRRRIFEIMAVAQRPLTLDELREALSVVPGNLIWDEKRLVNDMHKALIQYCGSLALVEEEEEAVEFAHPSIKQHLLTSAEDHIITLREADLHLGEVCVTYLNFPIHEKQLVSMRGSARNAFRVKHIPAAIMLDRLSRHTVASSMAIKLLKNARTSAKQDSYSFGLPEHNSGGTNEPDLRYPFMKYAAIYWSWHSRLFSPATLSYSLFCCLLKGEVSFIPQPWGHMAGKSGNVPLEWSATQGHEAAMKIFLARPEADPNSRGAWGSTPLNLASSAGHENIVKLLLTGGYGVDVNTLNKYGQTPLWSAATHGHAGIVDMLLDSGKADPDTGNHQGRTPLQKAAAGGHEGIVRRLLETHRVDADARDRHGRTPFRVAAEGGYENVVRILLQRDDVDVASRDEHGVTPLTMAAYNGHEHVVEILEAKLRALGLSTETGLVLLNAADGQAEEAAKRDAQIRATEPQTL